MFKNMSKVIFNTNKTACQQLLTKLCKFTLCYRSRIFRIFTCRMKQCFIGLRTKKHMLHGNIVNSFYVKVISRIIGCLKTRDVSKMCKEMHLMDRYLPSQGMRFTCYLV